MLNSLSVQIADPSQVGEARRTAITIASSLGFDETRQGALAIVITELANNILKHATRGELILRTLELSGVSGMEIMAVDNGAGMSNISQCMRDGYSTAGTPGHGLGSISRLSDYFEISSTPGSGTVLLVYMWAKSLERVESAAMRYGVINRAKPGQDICGDSWSVEQRGSRYLFFVADGLGHGPEAATASREAVRAFRKHLQGTPKEMLAAVHGAISGTRGVAGAIAELDLNKQEICFTGIGNIAGSVSTPTRSLSFASHNGILGHQARRFQEFTYPWTPDSTLVLHSDGLSNRWQLERYPGITSKSPGIIAGVLYRDFRRDNDDATVLIAQMTREASIA